ncbi:MAG TPA: hypothetical protein VGU46_05255 [Acidobacteriaceae bacterium]|nr:hypothetical protein [Acidobacteriaceae bacterium]
MKAARTHGTHSLVAALHAAKPALGPMAGLESFQTRMEGALTPDGIAGLAQGLLGGKGKALKDGETAEEAGAAKAGAIKKGTLGEDKDKTKHGTKVGDDASAGAAGAVAAIGVDANGLPVNGLQGSAQPVEVTKKELVDPNAPAINSASTSTLQQAPLPQDMTAGPVEVATAKQVEVSASEGKTKRVSVSAIAALSDKPAAAAVAADGTAIGAGGNGIAVGGVNGQGMQGGHSSGSAGHNGQPPASHPAAAAGPQVVASSPSQLDVGVYDDTHGWLRIRAELGAGGAVNASLTSADAAHESLKTALPAMTHYLGTEAVQVNHIELHTFANAPGGQTGSHADGQQQQSSMTGQHSRGDEQQQSSAQANVMAALDDAGSRNIDVALDSSGGIEVDSVAAVSSAATAAVMAADASGESVSVPSTGVDAGLTSESSGDVPMLDTFGGQFLPWQVGIGGSGGWVNVSA